MRKKLKPLLPSLREKKRYIAYEVLSDTTFDAKDANKAILDASKEFLGTLGMAKAGIIPLEDQYKNNKGMVRVNHRHSDHLKASLLFIKQINGKEVCVRSIGASGILKKTQQNYLK